MDALELTTTYDRIPIKIDGENYFLVNTDELELKDYLILRDQGKVFEGIQKIDEMDNEQVKELEKILNSMVERVLIAPVEVREKLNYKNRMALINFFFKELKKKNLETMISFPVSKDSTEGIPQTGSSSPSGT